VPTLGSSLENIMLNSEMRLDYNDADFVSDSELFFSRPLPVAVENPSPEQCMFREDSDIQDLDDTQLSIYTDSSCLSDNSMKDNFNSAIDQCYVYDNRVKIENPAFRPIKIEPDTTSNQCQGFCPEDICKQAYDVCVMDIGHTCTRLSIPMGKFE